MDSFYFSSFNFYVTSRRFHNKCALLLQLGEKDILRVEISHLH